jgi:hypothetical protein
MRRQHVALALAGIAGLTLLAAALYGPIRTAFESPSTVSTTSPSTGRALKPLPPGPPRESSAEASVGRAKLDDMIANAPVVFVGRVTAIGGSEVVSPASADEGPELTIHRTRFDVVEAMRSDVAIADVAQFDWSSVRFELGTTYLIFAETRPLGSLKLRHLVPYGYLQGVYEQLAPGVFGNEWNGSISIATLEERLREVPK